MQSALGKLNSSDWVRGAITAVYGGAVLAVSGILLAKGFDIWSADWKAIGMLAMNGAFGGFIGYLLKNATTDSDGTIHTPVGKIRQ